MRVSAAYFLGNGFDPSEKAAPATFFIFPADRGRSSTGAPIGDAAAAGKEAQRRLLSSARHGAKRDRGDKEYDRFLRAGYVVEDIEKLRRRCSSPVLGIPSTRTVGAP